MHDCTFTCTCVLCILNCHVLCSQISHDSADGSSIASSQSTNHAPSRKLSLQQQQQASYDKMSSRLSVDLDPVSLATKRGHVINELIETERTYVAELKSIIDGYLKPMENPAFNDVIPLELRNMNHVLFGNLEEIYQFHSECVVVRVYLLLPLGSIGSHFHN